jgi:hypothetical protein
MKIGSSEIQYQLRFSTYQEMHEWWTECSRFCKASCTSSPAGISCSDVSADTTLNAQAPASPTKEWEPELIEKPSIERDEGGATTEEEGYLSPEDEAPSYEHPERSTGGKVKAVETAKEPVQEPIRQPSVQVSTTRRLSSRFMRRQAPKVSPTRLEGMTAPPAAGESRTSITSQDLNSAEDLIQQLQTSHNREFNAPEDVSSVARPASMAASATRPDSMASSALRPESMVSSAARPDSMASTYTTASSVVGTTVVSLSQHTSALADPHAGRQSTSAGNDDRERRPILGAYLSRTPARGYAIWTAMGKKDALMIAQSIRTRVEGQAGMWTSVEHPVHLCARL